MEPDHTEAPRQEQPPLGFQFSLRAMFIVMTAAAAVLSGLFAGPGFVTAWTAALLAVLVPMVLTVVLVYSRGYMRTFCIGALFPAAWSGLLVYWFITDAGGYDFFTGYVILRGSYFDTQASLAASTLVACGLTLACGLVAIAVRWTVERAERA